MGSHKILIFCFDKITTTKKHFYIYTVCVIVTRVVRKVGGYLLIVLGIN